MGSQVLMELLPVGSAAGRIASCADDVSPSSSSYSSSSIFGVLQPRWWCSERSRVAASGSVATVVSIRSSSDPRRSVFGRRSTTARPHLPRVLMDPRLIPQTLSETYSKLFRLQ
jgi:hypothetical protein